VSTAVLFLRLGGQLPLRLVLAGPILTALIYGAYATASAIWSVDPALSAGKGIEFELLILNGAVLGYAVARDRLQRNFFTYTALCLFVVAIAFFISNTLIYGTPLYLETSVDNRTRLWFAYTHPLSVAHLASLGLLCAILSNLKIGLKLALVAFFGWILYLADARASVIGVGLGLVVLVITRNRTGAALNTRLLYLFLLLTALASVGAWIIINNADLVAALPSDVTSLDGRMGLWGTAFEFVIADPLRTLAGYGYFGSRFLLLSYYEWGGHTHQVLLEIMLTTGLIGVGIFLYYVRATFVLAMRAPGLMVILAYLAVVSFDDPVVFQPGVPMAILTWTISLFIAIRVRQPTARRLHGVRQARVELANARAL
jgi:O-antigen ligase